MDVNKLIHGDCLDVMKQMDDNSVDLVLTDPPYGLNYANNCDSGGKYGKVSGKKHIKKNWDYIILDKKYFNELLRISKNQIIWGGNYFIEHLTRKRCWIVWDKMNDNFYSTSDGELAWTSFNSRLRFFRRSHGLDKGFMNKGKFGNCHPTQKPVELFSWCLKKYSKENDIIFDGFAGSGTTALACIELNRKFICVEKDKDYYEIAKKRIEIAQSQGRLFDDRL